MRTPSSTQISPDFVYFWSSIAAPHGDQNADLIARVDATHETGKQDNT